MKKKIKENNNLVIIHNKKNEEPNTDTSTLDDNNIHIYTEDDQLLPKVIELSQNFGSKYNNMSLENTIKYLENELENKNKLILILKHGNRTIHVKYIGTFIILTILGLTTYTLISTTKKI